MIEDLLNRISLGNGVSCVAATINRKRQACEQYAGSVRNVIQTWGVCSTASTVQGVFGGGVRRMQGSDVYHDAAVTVERHYFSVSFG